jgi:hypothetical protein
MDDVPVAAGVRPVTMVERVSNAGAPRRGLGTGRSVALREFEFKRSRPHKPQAFPQLLEFRIMDGVAHTSLGPHNPPPHQPTAGVALRRDSGWACPIRCLSAVSSARRGGLVDGGLVEGGVLVDSDGVRQ